MWAVIARDLPLGVTPSVLRRCIEDALGERLISQQQAQISDDEALVYLPNPEIQNRLASVVVRCGGVKIQINKANIDEIQQWIINHGRNIQQSMVQNTYKYSKQNKREQRKVNLQEREREREIEQASLEQSDEEDLLMGPETETAGGRLSPPAPSPQDIADVDASSPHNDNNNIIDNNIDNASEPEEELSLCNQIPILLSEHPNRIIWYQYLIFVNHGQSPFYVTYPAEWCWDIEGQWLKFQEHYAINPSEAEKVDSRFLICDPQSVEKDDSSRCMVGDLLNMKITDNNLQREYEFKRTTQLIGILYAFGQIVFERFYESETQEIFLYDRSTGYHDGVVEGNNMLVGDYVVFEAWWNKDDYDNYHYDITESIKKNKNHAHNRAIHADMFAFNVKRANLDEEQELRGSGSASHNYFHLNQNQNQLSVNMNPYANQNSMNSSSSVHKNSNASLAYYDPLVADDFKGERFNGLVISLTKEDKMGFIVCFPYNKKDDDDNNDNNENNAACKNGSMTLLFHERFMRNPTDQQKLRVNNWVEFSIGVNPCNYGQGIFGYVAMDIIAPKAEAIILMMNNTKIPITFAAFKRQHRGRIIVPPTSILSKGCGFIYNEFENTMVRLEIKKSEEIADYHINSYVRYNEKKVDLNKDDDNGDNKVGGYKIIAVDPVIVQRCEPTKVAAYYTADNFVRYKAKAYVEGRKLRIDENRNIEFKYIHLTKKEALTHSDIYLIVEQSETYLNAFLNSDGGGVIVFGIQPDGRIVGQSAMSKAKRDYILDAVNERAKHFRPAVPSEYFVIDFKPVIDCDGFDVLDTYVIIVSVANLYTHDAKTSIRFETSNHQIYERGRNSQLTRLNSQAQQQQQRSSHAKQKLFPIKPKFTTFINIDRDDINQQNKNQKSNNRNNDNNNNNNNNNNNFAPAAPANQRLAIRYTTPSLNAKPIPPNTELGRNELADRVQLKLNEMMMVEEYMLDPRWQFILTMASSSLYNAQKTTWMLMKNLETEKVRKNQQQEQMNVSFASRSSLSRSPASHSLNNSVADHSIPSSAFDHSAEADSHNNQHNHSMEEAEDLEADNNNNNQLFHNNNNNNNNNNSCIILVDKVKEAIKVNNDPGIKVNNESVMNPNSSCISSISSSSSKQTEVDNYGLPILPDKSKYKAVAMEYCQKIGWKRPLENVQCIGTGYIATVSFGKPGQEISAAGNGLRQKNAIYEAYIKLVPIVIPHSAAVELMMKWVPGYRKQEKVSTATIAQSGQSIMKHPKSVLLEWAQKNSLAPPKTTFSEFVDSTRNMRMWTAKVTFCGKTIEFKGSKKKDAESKCFQELLKQVMDGNFKR